MDRLLVMECFARAVETGSFSAVARELGTSQPNVSRNIASLEKYLGTRLLQRSTRKLALTPEGERYYAEVRQVLDAVKEAESNARASDRPKGLLRVACPISMGNGLLVPRMKILLQRYPELRVDLQINEQYVDLIEDAVDLAIRIGTLKDSSLKARRIGLVERVAVASPAYLKHHPAPNTPQDLQRHNCIILSQLSFGATWPFQGMEVTVSSNLKLSTTDGLHRAVLDGLGIGYMAFWIVEDDLRAGRLDLLLPDYPLPAAPVQIVYPAKRLLSKKASVFMDFIADEFSKIRALNEGAVAAFLKSRPRRPRKSTS
jgi:LysR family transcriptional regulator, regulator for bpeEF and oprC